jgi:hypothetical protein
MGSLIYNRDGEKSISRENQYRIELHELDERREKTVTVCDTMKEMLFRLVILFCKKSAAV